MGGGPGIAHTDPLLAHFLRAHFLRTPSLRRSQRIECVREMEGDEITHLSEHALAGAGAHAAVLPASNLADDTARLPRRPSAHPASA